MPRHRNLNLEKFIRSVPEHLLQEYFEQLGVIEGFIAPESFDYENIKEYIDNNTDEELIRDILEDFTYINDICEKNMNILTNAMKRYGIRRTGEQERQEQAMMVFLHYPEAFEYAYAYYCIFNSTSKMSQHNIDTIDFLITDTKINNFERLVKHFYSDLNKGEDCSVRYFEKGTETTLVVWHGSYRRTTMVWQEEEVKPVYFRPATEDILQYDTKTKVLSIRAPYQRDRENYIEVFTDAIIHDKTQAKHPDRDNTYTLEALQNGTFSFAGNELIRSIILLEVKLKLRGLTNPEVVIKSSDILKTFRDDLPGIDLSSGDLVHAKFRFVLEVEGKRRTVTFEITPPNVTDLTTKKYADIIGDYLKENGVKLV